MDSSLLTVVIILAKGRDCLGIALFSKRSKIEQVRDSNDVYGEVGINRGTFLLTHPLTYAFWKTRSFIESVYSLDALFILMSATSVYQSFSLCELLQHPPKSIDV